MLTLLAQSKPGALRISFWVHIGGGGCPSLRRCFLLGGLSWFILQVVLPHSPPGTWAPLGPIQAVHQRVAHSLLQEGPGPRELAFRGRLGISPVLSLP